MAWSFSLFLIQITLVLIAVSFFTLYERKVLSYIHVRKGPNIVGWWGLLQPFSDAIKLFTKEHIWPYTSNFVIFTACPILSVSVAIMSWTLIPSPLFLFSFKLLIILFFIYTAIGVYTHLGAGWGSNSAYALIGAMRCVAQSVSYEVSLAFILILILMSVKSFDINQISQSCPHSWLLFMLPMVFFMWIISCVAETNRTPFDFAEGESELVSGFNVEYGSGSFALLFIAEYASIIFMSAFSVLLFLNGSLASPLSAAMVMLLMFTWVWLRATMPRTRYDKLMMACWKIILPSVLILMMWFSALL